MEGKVVLVTGATSGIGEAVAYLFASKGYSVAVHGRNPETVAKVVSKCDSLSPDNLSVSNIEMIVLNQLTLCN